MIELNITVECTHSTVKSCRMYTLYTFYDLPIECIHSMHGLSCRMYTFYDFTHSIQHIYTSLAMGNIYWKALYLSLVALYISTVYNEKSVSLYRDLANKHEVRFWFRKLCRPNYIDWSFIAPITCIHMYIIGGQVYVWIE